MVHRYKENIVNTLVLYDNLDNCIRELSNNFIGTNILTFDTGGKYVSNIIDQINNLKSKFNPLEELHLIAHGSSEGINIGNELIDSSKLNKYKSKLKKLNFKRIVLWSCHIGKNNNFISQLESLTGSEVFFNEDEINRNSGVVKNKNGNKKYLSQIIHPEFLINWEGSLNWVQIGSDIDGEASNDSSGISISLSGDGSTVAIGANKNSGVESKSGSVRVYQNNNDIWEQIGADIDGETANEQSANSIHLSSDGTTVAIGSERKNIDSIGNKTGVVRIYKNINSNWKKIGSDIEGEAAYDYFGHSVSLSSDGSVVAIGANKNDATGPYAGHVRVFTNDSDNWVQIGSDIDGENAYDYFGSAVSLSANGLILAAGAYKHDSDGTYKGHVRVFKNENNSWVQIGSSIDGVADNDHAGSSISLSSNGSILAIGSYGNDDGGDDCGHVRVFQNNNGSWEQIGNDIRGLNAGDHFGHSVDLSDDGSFLAVGANLNDDNGTSSGHVRVFQNNNGSWDEVGSSVEGESSGDSSGDSIGIALTSDDQVILAIGASMNDGNGTNSGHIRIFKFDEFDPTLKESSPAPNDIDIAVTTDISLKFSENMNTGSGNIYIKKTSDDSIIETYDVTGSQVTGSGTKQFLIDRRNILDSSTSYYIQIDNTAFEDLAGNNFSGVSDKTSLAFTTADVVAPTINSSTPADDATAVAIGSNIELTFSEAVDVESGNIYIKKSIDDSIVETIDITSTQVTGTGTVTILIDPTNDFISGTQYYLQIDASAFDDSSSNSFSGISDTTSLSFTSADVVAPVITGPSGVSGQDSDQISIKENSNLVYNFHADEIVNWSIFGGNDSSKFNINSETGSLSFANNIDFEAPTDHDADNVYELIVRATDNGNNTSNQILSIEVTDIGEKNNASDAHYSLSYTTLEGLSIEPVVRPKYGDLIGDVTLFRLSSVLTSDDNQNELSIGQTLLNLSLNLDESSVKNEVKLTTDLAPLLDGLTTENRHLIYYLVPINEDGSTTNVSSFTYDPITKTGARFYDINNDSLADITELRYIDGDYGDNDVDINGKTSLSPTTAATIDLKPTFNAQTSALKISDPNDTISKAAITVRVTISSTANSVNQIGYIALNSDEDETLTYDLISQRGSIILSNLENHGTPDVSDLSLAKDISLINGQKLIFFEVIDTTLESLLDNYSSFDEFGSSFEMLDLKNVNHSKAEANKNGNTITISLIDGISDINNLISSEMGIDPILDFSGLAGSEISGTVSLLRESNYDSIVGFYKIENSMGAVLNQENNTLIFPGENGYRDIALRKDNIFNSFGTLSTRSINSNTTYVESSDGSSKIINKNSSSPSNRNLLRNTIESFSNVDMIAPYAEIINTGNTFFSFNEANSDGLSHFRDFGAGTIGLEDILNGGDQDYDDLIISFDFQLS